MKIFLMGVSLGAVAGMVFSPAAGNELREKLKAVLRGKRAGSRRAPKANDDKESSAREFGETSSHGRQSFQEPNREITAHSNIAKEQPATSGGDEETYTTLKGVEIGGTRSPRRVQVQRRSHLHGIPEREAHEGAVFTRTPHSGNQGITSHSAQEESARQEKVVKDRPDALAGVNHNPQPWTSK